MVGGPYSGSASGTFDLTKIARYVSSWNVTTSRTLNTITVNWSTNETCSAIKYGTNSSNLTEKTVNAKSGSFTITDLTPNTAYTVYINFKRSDSGLYLSNNQTYKVTTYQIATLSSVPNVNIGNAHTITWLNPSGASLKLALYKTDSTTLVQDIGSVTGTSKTITPTASNIYPLIPNSKTITLRYILTTTQNNKSYTDYKDCVFTVTNSNPNFHDFEYKDTNETTVALTGNSQILISGYSNVKATVSVENKASAVNSATMKDYILAIGNLTDTKTYSSTGDVAMEVSKVTNATITVSANDSRGFSTLVTKVAEMKDYSKPVITQMLASRSDNGVGETVTLQFVGNWWNKNFGTVDNVIENIKYYYKKSTSTAEWIEGTKEITFSIENDKFTGNLSIEGDTDTKGFDASSSYFIMLIVNDKLDRSKEYQTTLGSGTPAIAISDSNVAIGQKYDTDLGGKLQVNGDINIPFYDVGEGKIKSGGEDVIRHYSSGATVLSGSSGTAICLRPKGADDKTNQATLTEDGIFTATKFTGDSFNGLLNGTLIGGRNYVLNSKREVTMVNPSSNYNQYTWNTTHPLGGKTTTVPHTYTLSFRYVPQAEGFHPCTSIVVGKKDGDNWSFRLDGKNSSWNIENCGDYYIYSKTFIVRGNSSDYLQTFVKFLIEKDTTAGGTVSYLKLEEGANKTDWIPNELEFYPTTLYNNSSGTTGTITLSESAANFSYLEICIMTSYNNDCFTFKVASPNGKTTVLNWQEVFTVSGAGASNWYVMGRRIQISGTSITTYNNQYGLINISGDYLETANRGSIVKVIGYR